MSDRTTGTRIVRRIDSHQHVFWWHRDDAGLVADLDEQGIDVAWLLSWLILPAEDAAEYHPVLNPLHARPDGTHAGIPLSDLILAKHRYPDRFVLGYCPHPGLGDAPQLFEAACRNDSARIADLHEQVVQLGRIYRVGRHASAIIKGLKCALSLCTVCDDFMAEPFERFHAPERVQIRQILQEIGLLA